MDDVIDDILVVILERIDSAVSLLRAASTCKRWHAIISDAAFLRRFRSAHAAALIAADYLNECDSKLLDRPSFVVITAVAASSIDARRLSLDFLSDDGKPRRRGAPEWAVLDSRGSLLLVLCAGGSRQPDHYGFPDVVVCEPLTRRWQRIPPPPGFNGHDCDYQGCFLVDGEVDVDTAAAGGRIGMSNFRVLYIFQHFIAAQNATCTGTAMFTAAAGSSAWGHWTPWVTLGASPSDAINQNLYDIRDLGRAGSCQYFDVHGRCLVVLDGATGVFSNSVLAPPPTNRWDFDIRMLRDRVCAMDGRDGKPRLVTVLDDTVKVYARRHGGGEWMLEKRVSLPEATRELAGYKEEFFCKPQPFNIWTRGLGYIILSPDSPEREDRWFISVDVETMQVALAADPAGAFIVFRCEVPWPPVLNRGYSCY